MNFNLRTVIAAFALLAVVSCSSVSSIFEDDDPALEGERISVLELQKSLEPDGALLEAKGLIAPAAWSNEFWPQSGGYPNHSMQHLDLKETGLTLLWKADIGDGSTGRLPLISRPVVVDGRAFTLDTDSIVSSFDIKTGKKLWRTEIRDMEEDDPVISGGIAYAGGVLFVTSGYDEILALKPGDGEILWRRDIPAPSRAAPTIIDGRIFITTLDNRLLALSASDGSVLWEYAGLSETAGIVGAASPAANRDIVVPVFSSGEITALRVENGSVAWSDNLSSIRRFGGLASLSDIKALPVIDKGLVIAISFSGRLVAIDERSGERVWQREIGGSNMPWLAGNHLFVLSSDNELIALGRENGAINWITQLPKYEDEKDLDDPIMWAGPVFAGDRLILAGTGGRIIEVAPETGKIKNNWDAGNTISVPPVVAGGVLYLLSEDGTLSAYH